ncbi:hypothetical protein [Nocardia sp. NPDC059239]|uniref:hypothetical protein n=1 Tax=unclassified Nocardia TaxID=2637762 RepID=UPI00367B1A4B
MLPLSRQIEQARSIAPELTRNHPLVHETIRVLARARRSTDTLTHFAKLADIKI